MRESERWRRGAGAMEPSVRRVRVVCVARNAIKAQFLMSVASASTVRALAPPPAAAQPRLRSFSLWLLWAPPPPCRDAAHCPLPRPQVKDARRKIQKLFAKVAQSQSQLVSCAALLPPPLHRRDSWLWVCPRSVRLIAHARAPSGCGRRTASGSTTRTTSGRSWTRTPASSRATRTASPATSRS
eukprot:COSAG04_NODE_3142_length_3126_cov_1.779650_3_plen_184_part_00